jgi:predicted secreted protein
MVHSSLFPLFALMIERGERKVNGFIPDERNRKGLYRWRNPRYDVRNGTRATGAEHLYGTVKVNKRGSRRTITVKRGIALALAFAVTLIGHACAETGKDTSSLTVRFAENPTTGYTWSVSVSDNDVLAVIDNGYVADEAAETTVTAEATVTTETTETTEATATTEAPAGAGGAHSWIVAGKGKGEATVRFSLTQGTLDGDTAATVGYDCSVDKNSRLTVTALTGVPEYYMPDHAVIELKENPSTGYEWTYKADVEGILTPERDAYTETAAAVTEDLLVGAGGVHLWAFVAETPGDVTLTFTYVRAWESGSEPAATVTYTYHVDAGLNATLTATGGDYAAYKPDAAAD